MSKRKTLYLIDVAGLIYRFFYTLPPMTAPGGLPTNAAYGFARTLLTLNREHKPDYLVPAMESKTPTFRHQLYSEYKAHREKMPDNLRVQIPIVEEIILAMGLTPAQADGYEADDIIGTMANAAADKDLDVFIITGDKDMLQLVTEKVHVLMSKKGTSDLEEFDPAKVAQIMGVSPRQIIDLKALEGDKSDNIPGVPGVGNKTAIQLLSRFKTVEDIYNNLEQIEHKALKTKLSENRTLADLSKTLATIKLDAPIQVDLDKFTFIPAQDPSSLSSVFTRYDFRSLINELGLKTELSAMSEDKLAEMSTYFRTIFSLSELEAFLDQVKTTKRLCIDLETTGLNIINDQIVGFALATEIGKAVYVPVRHKMPDLSSNDNDIFGFDTPLSQVSNAKAQELIDKQLGPDSVLDTLRSVLADDQIHKLGHNLKFDISMLRSAGVEFHGVFFDSMIASYILNPSSRGHSLKNVASHRLGVAFKKYDDIVGKGKDQICFSEVTIDIATEYACFDVDMVLRMEMDLLGEIEKNNLMSVYETLEIPLINVLADMELQGIAIDENILKQLSIEMLDKELAIIEQVSKMTNKNINLNSPKQIAELLFDDLGLPSVRKRSTDVNVLEELQFAHDVVPLIMEFRQISKLRGTYADALPSLINKNTKRIHTSFNQHITATGRLSSSDPNLQNIPIRTEAGREIRKAFIPGVKGHVLLTADYSQIEIRLLAELSKDPNLIDAFIKEQDIHARTAAAVFSVDINDVTKDQRRYAKTINFGLIYGMREFNLARTLGISRQEAVTFIENYFSQYPSVRNFIEETQNNVVETGYVTTMFGRRRYVPEVNSRNKNEQQAGFRAAFNTIIQGTAADIIKLAMIQVQESIKNGEIKAKMLLQVHDELVFEVPEAQIQNTGIKVKDIMENCVKSHFSMTVPLVADLRIGPNWLETEPFRG